MIGKMNSRITVQEEVVVTNARGGKDKTWKDLMTVWGEVITLAGNPYKYGDELERNNTHKITVRYNVEIKKNHRLMVGSEYFIINADPIKDNFEKKRFLTLIVNQTDTDL